MALGQLEMSILIEVEIALEFSKTTGSWVVLVCPDSEVAAVVAKTLALARPVGSVEGGRTLVLVNGGRVSVVPADSAVMVPDGKAFIVELAGWRNHIHGGSWGHWQDRASGMLTPDSF